MNYPSILSFGSYHFDQSMLRLIQHWSIIESYIISTVVKCSIWYSKNEALPRSNHRAIIEMICPSELSLRYRLIDALPHLALIDHWIIYHSNRRRMLDLIVKESIIAAVKPSSNHRNDVRLNIVISLSINRCSTSSSTAQSVNHIPAEPSSNTLSDNQRINHCNDQTIE